MPKNPLSLGDAGDQVAAVHKLLQLHGVSVPEDEVAKKVFGPGTSEAVAEFQRNQGVAETKEVAADTAKLLMKEPATAGSAQPASASSQPVSASSQPVSASSQPVSQIAQPASGVGQTTIASTEASSVLTNISALAGTVVDLGTVGVNPDAAIPNTPPGNGSDHLVSGRVLLDQGLPANGLKLRFYNKDFGGDVRISETTTDATGAYSLPYSAAAGKAVNLEVRAVDATGNEVSLSDTKFNAAKQETINLVAPRTVQAVPSEFTRLRSDVEGQIGSLDKLASAQEAGERQDLTLLANSTGWDARLIAFAANGTKLSAQTGIPTEALYAAHRVGLPTDPEHLAEVPQETFAQVLTKAKDAGVVSLNDQQVTAAKSSFANFQRTTRLAAKAPGAASTFAELLNVAGSTAATKLNDNEKQAFADVYFSDRNSAGELWQQARAKGVPEPKINALRLEGKLSYLTTNNANLVAKLQTEIGSTENLSALVQRDLYKDSAWKSRLAATDVPANYVGGADAYAAELARKVRITYPTQVVARMVQNDELSLGENHAALKTPVQTFLNNAVNLGFEVGRHPLGTFIKENSDAVFNGIAAGDRQATTEKVETLHRLYQVTPSNEALSTAMNLGFKSAHDVTAFPEKRFLELFGKNFRTPDEARLFYKKSEQVTTVIHSLVTSGKVVEATPPIFAISAPAADREQARNDLIKHFPTMESLFGGLDFCECEHCRSVLSPAAYFVDLLQFLDPKPLVWTSTMSEWKLKHNGAPYPFVNQKAADDFLAAWRAAHPGQADPNTQKTPFEVLIERRPDLPQLALTCENTNTALPYIDVVNEILEYYVAQEKLDEDAVRNTGTASTPELLAEPENVTPAAYVKLKGAHYPLNLPFDLWLETVRQFFEQSDSSLWKVLDLLRPADELFAPPVAPKAYYRDSIFLESLGLSPAERDIFTASSPLTRWFELYGYANEADALSSLKSAKTLSRRLGVTYNELVDLVQTRFVNLPLDALVILRKLEVDAVDLLRYEGQAGYPAFTADEKQAFEKRIADVGATVNVSFADLKPKLDAAFKATQVNQLLLLNDPDTGPSFDLTTLRYGDGKDVDALAFLKLNLFVRLWRKLGWTMEETDRALQVFLPQSSLPLTAANIGAAMGTALIYLAHLKALKQRVSLGKDAILKLLTLWSNLSVTGRNPLYGQLFLKKSILKNDAVFDDPLGQYLSKPGLFIKNHALAVQSALNLTTDDLNLILADSGQLFETAPLSIQNLSLLFRYGLTARALKISVSDLIGIKALSGLDPFTALSAPPLAKIEDDHPFKQTLKFFEIAAKIKESGFKPEDLDYLFRHHFDPVGKYRSNTPALLDLVRTLATEIQRIQSEQALNVDMTTFTDDVLRQKLALALPADTAETFLAMWNGTKEYEAKTEGVLEADQLKPEQFAQVSSIKVSYDKTRRQQQLTFRGVLTDAALAQLKVTFPSPLVGGLLDNVNKQAHDFFNQNLLKSAAALPFTGFLDARDFDGLLAPDGNGLSDVDKQNRLRTKRERLANVFLPFLQQRLIRQLILQTAVNNFAAEPGLLETLLTRADMLSDPAFAGAPLLDAFAAAGQAGVTVSHFAGNNQIGSASTVATVDTKGKPATTTHSRFLGYIEVPANGAYRFFVTLDKKDATAELRFDHLADPLISGAAAADGAELSQFTELKSGLLYGFTVEFKNFNGGDAAMLVSSQDLPKGPLARLKLYPSDTVDRISRSYVLLSKTLLLNDGFGFSEGELQYFLTHASDFGNLDLSQLPTSETQGSASTTVLFGSFIRLCDFTSLKRELADSTNDLLAIFQNSRRSFPATADATQASNSVRDDVCNRLATLTRRDAAKVKEAADSLGFRIEQNATPTELRLSTPGFTDERGISRLWEVLKVSERLGVSAGAVVRWATPAPDFAIARELKDTVKARYETENWQRIAQPVFDKLRQKQRDALVAHTINTHGFERPEQLFEFFLIDPGMEPVVQTSRLQLAIASLQTFIQRCLLNLEPQVSPSVINTDHWQWMKRYRVWEANRKIFLFPENWLEPEFRDDKTYQFQELESALLQGDVSADSVEDAFYQYLKKLEEIARLEMVAMYCDRQPEPEDNVYHVVGRTYALPHKYFYRRYAHQMWTPWEPISTEIDGDHIVAVIWRERLHLFWLTFMERAKKNSSTASAIGDNDSIGKVVKTVAGVTPVKEVDVQLNWSELFQGEWTPRRSSSFMNLNNHAEFSSFNSNDVFVSAYKEFEDGEERALRISLNGVLNAAFRVVSKHSQPEKANTVYWLNTPYSGTASRTQYYASDALEVTFVEQIQTVDGKITDPKQTTQKILNHGGAYSLLACNDLFGLDTEALGRAYPNQGFVDRDQRLTDLGKFFVNEYLPTTLTGPFFYQDSQNTFFVEPTLTETTIDRWEEWVIPNPGVTHHWDDLVVDKIPIEPHVPPDPRIRVEIDPGARFTLTPNIDWATHPATLLSFDDRLIGRNGSVPISVRELGGAAEVAVMSSAPAVPMRAVSTAALSSVASGSGASALATAPAETALSGNALTVVSGSGLNAATLEAITSTPAFSRMSGTFTKIKGN